MGETDCIQPGAVTPADLVAYAEGEAGPDVVAHIRRCAHCGAEARAYARTDRRLRQVLYRADCPSTQTLGEYELGLLTPTQRQEVAAHALDCPRCADELKALRDFMAGDLVEADDLSSVTRRLRQLVATLVPSTASPAFAGLRGATDQLTQVYRTDAMSITVEWRPGARPGLASLVGLVLSDDESDLGNRPVRLSALNGRSPELYVHDRTDELGNFTFDGLKPGAYRLEIDLADATVVAALRWDG
jgi:anti-sigma factor RsiW